MYRNTLVALDGSEGSDRALPVAVEYARREGARIEVAHARTHAIEPSVEARLHEEVEELVRSGIEASVSIRDSLMGREADVIAELATSTGADLIVIASRGRGPVAGALLGSVTLRLLSLAPCPVLVVPGARLAKPPSNGVATSGSAVKAGRD
jgi:nucleotide-binding universal stress UspA family protein